MGDRGVQVGLNSQGIGVLEQDTVPGQLGVVGGDVGVAKRVLLPEVGEAAPHECMPARPAETRGAGEAMRLTTPRTKRTRCQPSDRTLDTLLQLATVEPQITGFIFSIVGNHDVTNTHYIANGLCTIPGCQETGGLVERPEGPRYNRRHETCINLFGNRILG